MAAGFVSGVGWGAFLVAIVLWALLGSGVSRTDMITAVLWFGAIGAVLTAGGAAYSAGKRRR